MIVILIAFSRIDDFHIKNYVTRLKTEEPAVGSLVIFMPSGFMSIILVSSSRTSIAIFRINLQMKRTEARHRNEIHRPWTRTH